MPRYPIAVGLLATLVAAATGSAQPGVRAQEAATPAPPADAYAAVVEATSGLVAYWRLDEATGTTAVDRSGQENDAAYAPGVELGEPGLIGPANAAIALAGTADGYVDAGDILDFAGGAPFTLEAWIRPDEFANPYPRLLMKEATDEAGNRQGYLLYISKETGRLGFERWRDGEANVVTTIEPISLGAATHVVAVYDGQAMRLYIDGEGIAEVPAGLGLNDTEVPVPDRRPRRCRQPLRRRRRRGRGLRDGARRRDDPGPLPGRSATRRSRHPRGRASARPGCRAGDRPNSDGRGRRAVGSATEEAVAPDAAT
jgi:hypothetical protein